MSADDDVPFGCLVLFAVACIVVSLAGVWLVGYVGALGAMRAVR